LIPNPVSSGPPHDPGKPDVHRTSRRRKHRRPSSRTSRIRVPDAGGAAGPQSSELAERKEEQTNYEINSKVVSTVRNSYTGRGPVDRGRRQRARIDEMLGGEPTEEQTAAYLAELQQVVATASGIDRRCAGRSRQYHRHGVPVPARLLYRRRGPTGLR
jgi:flagellar biosynthesis/type III secretory pathway M-ring protein FliF/YscJ